MDALNREEVGSQGWSMVSIGEDVRKCWACMAFVYYILVQCIKHEIFQTKDIRILFNENNMQHNIFKCN